jgi:hypothetical protein
VTRQETVLSAYWTFTGRISLKLQRGLAYTAVGHGDHHLLAAQSCQVGTVKAFVCGDQPVGSDDDNSLTLNGSSSNNLQACMEATQWGLSQGSGA